MLISKSNSSVRPGNSFFVKNGDETFETTDSFVKCATVDELPIKLLVALLNPVNDDDLFTVVRIKSSASLHSIVFIYLAITRISSSLIKDHVAGSLKLIKFNNAFKTVNTHC